MLAEKEAPVNKKIVEVLGSYNPRKKMFRIKAAQRLQYWIDQKVAMSPTVQNLFVTNKVLEGGKVKAFTIPKKEEVKAEAPAGAAPAETITVADEPKAEAQPAPTPSEAVVGAPTPDASVGTSENVGAEVKAEEVKQESPVEEIKVEAPAAE